MTMSSRDVGVILEKIRCTQVEALVLRRHPGSVSGCAGSSI